MSSPSSGTHPVFSDSLVAREIRGPSLRAKDLRTVLHTAAGTVRAVDGIELELRPGECFALVGESGCGKSMTALSIMRLLPEAASSSTASTSSACRRRPCARCAASAWR